MAKVTFGSVDGDSAAAMRYISSSSPKIAGELLTDLDKDTVDFVLTMMEPVNTSSFTNKNTKPIG